MTVFSSFSPPCVPVFQKLFYSPQHSEEEFKATPRGSFRTTVATAGGGGGVIEIGPASDEAVVSIAVDGAGIIRAIHVVPIDSSPETEEEGVPPPSVTSMIAAQGMGGSHDIACGDQGSEREQGANAVDAHVIYPAKHHVVGGDEMDRVLEAITMELEERCALLGSEGRVLEAERLRQRTENDLLLLRAVGTCKVALPFSNPLRYPRVSSVCDFRVPFVRVLFASHSYSIRFTRLCESFMRNWRTVLTRSANKVKAIAGSGTHVRPLD